MNLENAQNFREMVEVIRAINVLMLSCPDALSEKLVGEKGTFPAVIMNLLNNSINEMDAHFEGISELLKENEELKSKLKTQRDCENESSCENKNE